ncbi:hypothetical protein ABK730_12695 [Klebsiella indica]|uniref:Uncharacterized protein n=1 Tax=Klebsiella indica TaxID=2582917 RepID=A0A5R9LKH6_9ENTR|nr:hypothetical protein [Klebsiella indica]TLV20609.1 hypothetical protein FE839_08080 [Klebsiella indica]
MPDISKSARRMSALQKNILIVLAALDQRKHMPVATKDIERVLEQGGEKPVYGSNLRAACRKLEEAGFVCTLRARNLQLAVELTETGKATAYPLLEQEKREEQAKARTQECHVLPASIVTTDINETEIEINDKCYSVYRCAYVIRLNKTTCLQLWRSNGKPVKLEGDALQIAEWYKKCYDAGIQCRIQINEGDKLSPKSIQLLSTNHYQRCGDTF